jgi:hypothetical protein
MESRIEGAWFCGNGAWSLRVQGLLYVVAKCSAYHHFGHFNAGQFCDESKTSDSGYPSHSKPPVSWMTKPWAGVVGSKVWNRIEVPCGFCSCTKGLQQVNSTSESPMPLVRYLVAINKFGANIWLCEMCQLSIVRCRIIHAWLGRSQPRFGHCRYCTVRHVINCNIIYHRQGGVWITRCGALPKFAPVAEQVWCVCLQKGKDKTKHSNKTSEELLRVTQHCLYKLVEKT